MCQAWEGGQDSAGGLRFLVEIGNFWKIGRKIAFLDIFGCKLLVANGRCILKQWSCIFNFC